MFGKGISKEGDILDLAVNLNLVNKSGAWFAYNGEKIGQGRENAKNYLSEHPDVMEELDKKIREHYQFGGEVKEPEDKETPVKATRKRTAKEEEKEQQE